MLKAWRKRARQKANIGQKRRMTKVYPLDGGHILFVPFLQMRPFHDAAREYRPDRRRLPPTDRALIMKINERLERPPKISTVFGWLKLFEKYPWFRDWLLLGKALPDHVHVAAPTMIERCQRAFDYVRHCRLANRRFAGDARPKKGIGICRQAYIRWFKVKLIPSLEWLYWLYGGKPPQGCLIVEEWLQRLRFEKTQDAICAAAEIGKTTLHRWKKDLDQLRALEEAIKRACAIGGQGPPVGFEPWDRLPAEIKANMWKYAQKATLNECCKRAGCTESLVNDALRAAELLDGDLPEDSRNDGILENLKRYLNLESRSTEGTHFLRRGLVAKNFYIPTRRMFPFRKVAREEWARQQISKFKANLPGFDDWFLDWATPGMGKGQRYTLPRNSNGAAENGTKQNGQRNGHNSTSAGPLAGNGGERTGAGWSPPAGGKRETHRTDRTTAIEERSYADLTRTLQGKDAPKSSVLTAEEWTILGAIQEKDPVAVLQCDLEAHVDVSRRTIGRGLSRLRELKLVARPRGQRKGDALTDLGRKVLARKA